MLGIFNRRAVASFEKSFGPLSQTASYQILTRRVNKIPVYEPLPKLRHGRPVMEVLAKQQMKKYDPTGIKKQYISKHNESRLRTGDVVRVNYTDKSPSTVGQIIGVFRKGIASSILLRNQITNLGVEIRVPLFNPSIESVDLIRKPNVVRPRNKHYYIRNTKIDVGPIEPSLKKKHKFT